MSFTDSSTDSATSRTLHEKTDITDAFQVIDLSPQSPPEYEKGLKQFDHVPKSPIYPLQMTFLTSLIKDVPQTWKMKWTTQPKLRKIQEDLKLMNFWWFSSRQECRHGSFPRCWEIANHQRKTWQGTTNSPLDPVDKWTLGKLEKIAKHCQPCLWRLLEAKWCWYFAQTKLGSPKAEW